MIKEYDVRGTSWHNSRRLFTRSQLEWPYQFRQHRRLTCRSIRRRRLLPIDPWTGFYFGANGGAGWGSKTFLDNFPTPDLALDAQPSVNGGLAGLQAGYDYHFFNWLLVGVQGDFTWSGIINDSFSCFSFGDQDCSAHPEWFATTTGHIGATFGPFAIYGKGGAASVENSYTDVATAAAHSHCAMAGFRRYVAIRSARMIRVSDGPSAVALGLGSPPTGRFSANTIL